MREYIKDAAGRLIGQVDERNGDTWVYNAKGNLLGRFQHSNNQTVDARGNRIGVGNQAMRLIPSHDKQ
ncbi:MAG: hypothetical protein WCK35_24300 [Chloroflexota bacterium]